MFLIELWLRGVFKQAAYQVVEGRMIVRDRPEKGRFLRHHVDNILKLTWHNLDEMLPVAQLDKLPSIGNGQNVYLAVATMAAYHAFLEADIEKDYAIELLADLGWKVYTKMIGLPRFIARLVSRDPQKQINFILRLLMIYPFSAPGRPGYEVKAWAESDRFCTYWTHCPPFAFVKQLIERNGDGGEVEAFNKSWCWYDWAATYAMVAGGHNKLGYYVRTHTLSAGDDVCDMEWYAKPSDYQSKEQMENSLNRKEADQ